MLVKEKSGAAWQVRGTGQIYGKEFGVYQVWIGTLEGTLNLVQWKAIFFVPIICTVRRWIQMGKVTYPAELRGLDGLPASCQVLVPFALLFCINWNYPLLFPAPIYLYESFEIRNQ